MSEKIAKILEQFKDQVEKSTSILKEELLKMEEASKLVTGGTILKIEPCRVTGVCAGYTVEVAKSHFIYSRPTWSEHVRAAREALFIERQRIEELHAKNIPAIENNLKVKDRVIALMQTLGIEKEFQTYATASSRSTKKQWITHQAGYLSDLNRVCLVSDGYAVALEVLNNFDKKIKDYELKSQQEERQALIKKQREEKQQENLKRIAKLAAKYNVDMDLDDIREAIFSLDKYLRLAHFLYENREDWNEGPSLALQGLSQFNAVSELDLEIYKEISAIVENWQGDGRVFRDCQYNYDFLFSISNVESLKDYQLLKEIESTSH